MNQPIEFVMNIYRGSLVYVYNKFDEENPPDKYIQYAEDEGERFLHYVDNITETIIKTPSDIDTIDGVIIDLVNSANALLFISLGRIWSQNRDSKTIKDLWEKTPKTLILFDESLSKWLQYLKKCIPDAVSIFGFEEDGRSRKLWIQSFKELYENILDRSKPVDSDKMRNFLRVDEKAGTLELKKTFLKKIKTKIVRFKKLIYMNSTEVKTVHEGSESTYNNQKLSDQILDLNATSNTLLYIMIGRIWFQNRTDKAICDLWKRTWKTLNLFDDSLSEWVQNFKKFYPDAVKIFGFEEDGRSRQPWIQLFKQLCDRPEKAIFLRNNFEKMRNCLPDNKNGGNENKIFQDFLEFIKTKIDDIKNLIDVDPIEEVTHEVKNDREEVSKRTSNNLTLSYHVPTCHDIVNLAAKAYTIVNTRIERFWRCARSENWKNKTKIVNLWNITKEELCLFNDKSLLEWLKLLPKDARSILGFETDNSRQPWIAIFAELYDRFAVREFSYFLNKDFDQMRNFFGIQGNNNEVFGTFVQLINIKIYNIMNLFFVKPIEEVPYNDTKLFVYEFNEDQDEEAIKLSERTSNYHTQPSDVPACKDIMELAKKLCSIVKMKNPSFLDHQQIKNTINENSDILSWLKTNLEATSKIGFGAERNEELIWIKILKELNDRFLKGYTYFLEEDFKEMETCLEKRKRQTVLREKNEVLGAYLTHIRTKYTEIEMKIIDDKNSVHNDWQAIGKEEIGPIVVDRSTQTGQLI